MAGGAGGKRGDEMDTEDVRRMGLGGMGEDNWLTSLISGGTSLFSSLQQKKVAEAQAKTAAEVAKAQVATQEAQKQIAAAKAQQAAALVAKPAPQQSNFSKYLPYVAGGLLVVGGIVFLSSRRK